MPGSAGHAWLRAAVEILHVLRLCDEAATNVVRHANASSLTIEFGLMQHQFRLRLSDNGRGGARETTAGHGMRNMHKRATQLGVTLDVDSGADGTSLVLTLPANPGALPVQSAALPILRGCGAADSMQSACGLASGVRLDAAGPSSMRRWPAWHGAIATRFHRD